MLKFINLAHELLPGAPKHTIAHTLSVSEDASTKNKLKIRNDALAPPRTPLRSEPSINTRRAAQAHIPGAHKEPATRTYYLLYVSQCTFKGTNNENMFD